MSDTPESKPVAFLYEELGYCPGDGRREVLWEDNPHAVTYKRTPLYSGEYVDALKASEAIKTDMLQRQEDAMQRIEDENAKLKAKADEEVRLQLVAVREIAQLQNENARLKADIQEMVNKAADNSLEGYRELGRRAADAENKVDALKAELAIAKQARNIYDAAHKREVANVLRLSAELAVVREEVATVAEVHMSRYTIEWKNGPLPAGTKLYAARKP